MTLTYTVRPISDRSQFHGVPAPGARKPFSASWSSTLDLLDRELYYLHGRQVVLELDVRENQIRVDGQLRADASATSTAVRVAFDSIHGPLIYSTDRYGYDYYDRPRAQGWQDNVRAIALGLEALRKVDRYGISRRGEQYRGYKAIAGVPLGAAMTEDEALAVLRKWGTNPADGPARDRNHLARAARIAAHPDRHGGDHTASNEVLTALAALGLERA